MPAHKFPIRFSIDENGCHNCTSHAKNKLGYAVFRHPDNPSKKCLIHRYMYSQRVLNGKPIPDGLLVRHKCDNPSCINPEHLELGTHQDNSDDAIKRGRLNDRKGSKNGRSKLTDDNVIEIFFDKRTQVEIAKSYGVSQVMVGLIKMRKSWAHITGSL